MKVNTARDIEEKFSDLTDYNGYRKGRYFKTRRFTELVVQRFSYHPIISGEMKISHEDETINIRVVRRKGLEQKHRDEANAEVCF